MLKIEYRYDAMFDTAEDLKLRLRAVNEERVRLLKAIEAYGSAPAENWLAGLDLNDLAVKGAVVELLEHAASHGKQDMSAGQEAAMLKGFRVRTSRGAFQ
jgi:hypothetical protein